MKSKVLLLFMSLLCIEVVAQPLFEKDVYDNVTRDRYLKMRYGLTEYQISAYDQAVQALHISYLQLDKQPLTKEQWKEGDSNIKRVFELSVKGILGKDEYDRWICDNCHSNTIRRYRENLNLSDDQFKSLMIALKECEQAMSAISKQRLSNKERSSRQREALHERRQALVALLGESGAEDLIYAIDLEGKASFVRNCMPELSREQSYEMGRFFLDFTNTRFKSDNYTNSQEQRVKEQHDAYVLLLSQIENYLSREELEIWNQRYYSYHDTRLCHDMNMSETQFDLFKNIMNNRAVSRLAVARKGFKGEAKEEKFRVIDLQTKQQIEELISEEAAKIWFDNLTK